MDRRCRCVEIACVKLQTVLLVGLMRSTAVADKFWKQRTFGHCAQLFIASLHLMNSHSDINCARSVNPLRDDDSKSGMTSTPWEPRGQPHSINPSRLGLHPR